MKRLLILIFFLAAPAYANDVYISQTGGGNGTSCVSTEAASYFNNAANWSASPTGIQIGPGTTVHLCGTITTTLTTSGAGGTSGNPITILWEAGAKLSEPVCPGGGQGCLNIEGSWFVLNGGTPCGPGTMCSTTDGTGIIEATANGTNLANHLASEGLELFNNSNITVENLVIRNIYVSVFGDTIDSSTASCIEWGGSNITIENNTFHDAGWCEKGFFNAGTQTNWQVHNNDIIHTGHCAAYATSGNFILTNLNDYSNHCHDGANWGDSGCNGAHLDGIHMFGHAGSSVNYNGVYIHDNLYDGAWGTCPTGFLFIESSTGGGTPSNAENVYVWNNVGVVQTPTIQNSNGWFNLSAQAGGVLWVLNNTVLGGTNTDVTYCFTIAAAVSATVMGNVSSSCGGGVFWDVATTVPNTCGLNSNTSCWDYNFFGPVCANGATDNCFSYKNPDAFVGSYAAWKSACKCDAHSPQNNTPLLNTNGTPQSGSPVIREGFNLSNRATGLLAGLQNDSTDGGTRTTLSRPAAGTCNPQGLLPCWDDGAFQFSGGGGPTLTSIAVTPNPTTILAGGTQQYTATCTYSDSSMSNCTGSVSWSSSNTLAATINSGGLATALNQSTTVTITATSGAISGNASLTVYALTSISVTPNPATILAGNTQQYAATGTYANGSMANLTNTVAWSSSSTATATINSAGLATGQNTPSTVTISAALYTITGNASLTVNKALVSIAVTPSNPTVIVGGNQQFAATGTYTDGSMANITSSVTWTSSMTLVATINTGGLATALSIGMTTIQATQGAINGSALMTVVISRIGTVETPGITIQPGVEIRFR